MKKIMAVLDTDLQQKIDDQIVLADEYWETDQSKYFNLLQQAWQLYPDPKESWNEAYSLSREIFTAYLEIKDFESAEQWLKEMIRNNDTLHLSEGDCQFNEAKFLFETGKPEEALILFKKVVKDAGMRYFEDENDKYKEFYKKAPLICCRN